MLRQPLRHRYDTPKKAFPLYLHTQSQVCHNTSLARCGCFSLAGLLTFVGGSLPLLCSTSLGCVRSLYDFFCGRVYSHISGELLCSSSQNGLLREKITSVSGVLHLHGGDTCVAATSPRTCADGSKTLPRPGNVTRRRGFSRNTGENSHLLKRTRD